MSDESKSSRKRRAEEIKQEYKAVPWREDPTETDSVSWEDVDGLLIAYVVNATTQAGASAQFTRSRDGGALGVRVYDDDIKTKTEWAGPGEGLEELLFAIADYYRTKIGLEALRWS